MFSQRYWAEFWDTKAGASTDFEATGRRRLSVVDFLYTVKESARLLDLQRNDRLLDIGCGTGIFALAVSPFVASITAFDISPAVVTRANANLSDVENVTADVGSITAIPVEDNTFHKALAYSVLQYLGSRDEIYVAFKEIARALVPGGKALLAANPDPLKLENYLSVICSDDDHRSREIAFQNNLLWIGQAEIIEIAAKAGLAAHTFPLHSRIWQNFYMYDVVVQHALES